jgi:hypothetical protein
METSDETNDTTETSDTLNVEMEDEKEDDSVTTSGDIEDCAFEKNFQLGLLSIQCLQDPTQKG